MSELNQLSDMNLTPEGLDKADEGAGFNLIVPSTVARKDGVAKWMEFVKVLDAYREDEVGGQGQTRLKLSLQYQVVQGGTGPENVDRTATLFLRLNPGYVNGKRKESLGQGDPQKEKTMHSMSMKKFKQLMASAGLSLNQGLSAATVDALFPIGSKSTEGILLGKTLVFMIQDNAKEKYKGANKQEPSDILAAPQGA